MKIFDGFRETPPYKLTPLGAPKGKAVDEALNKKVEDLERAISQLVLLQSHDVLCLLRNSISISKLLFLLYTWTAVHIQLPSATIMCRGRGLMTILHVDLNNDQ